MSFVVELSPTAEADLQRLFDFLLDQAETTEELDRAHVIEPTNDAFNRRVVWCAPAFANKRAYIRNDEECICIDLAAE